MAEAPAISILHNLIKLALSQHASDIHLEPNKDLLKVRFRVDGLLYDRNSILREHSLQVISRIKVLAQMNVAERRKPLDGKILYKIDNQDIDLRISTFPTIYGEKIVIRILLSDPDKVELDNLGFSSSLLKKVKKISQSLNGFFLVTGPTGSGKTTTLHGMLVIAASPHKNVITLENPIEYHREGITQGQIHHEIGFDFQTGMRAILRQDPDVIMIGEIRDKETAQVSLQAALTGHFVLSTLHNNDTPSALMRLLDMGIPPFLINATLTGILAQRLVRKLCVDCRYEDQPKKEEIEFTNFFKCKIIKLFRAKGCNNCMFTGYKGRIGIFELLEMNNNLRAKLTQNPIIDDIYSVAYNDGMEPLIFDAIDKVNSGLTSVNEVMRVLL